MWVIIITYLGKVFGFYILFCILRRSLPRFVVPVLVVLLFSISIFTPFSFRLRPREGILSESQQERDVCLAAVGSAASAAGVRPTVPRGCTFEISWPTF